MAGVCASGHRPFVGLCSGLLPGTEGTSMHCTFRGTLISGNTYGSYRLDLVSRSQTASPLHFILGHTLNAREPRLEAGRIMIYY